MAIDSAGPCLKSDAISAPSITESCGGRVLHILTASLTFPERPQSFPRISRWVTVHGASPSADRHGISFRHPSQTSWRESARRRPTSTPDVPHEGTREASESHRDRKAVADSLPLYPGRARGPQQRKRLQRASDCHLAGRGLSAKPSSDASGSGR